MSGPTNDDLTNTLHKRADDFARLGGHDLDLSQVVNRAGEIRRGRRMMATMAMAAVTVAVAVPVGVSVLGSDPAGNDKPPIASNSADPTPTDLGRISLGDLPVGDTTEVGLFYDGKVYLPDRELELPGSGEVRDVVRIRGGFLVARADAEGNQQVSYVGIEDPGTSETWPTNGNGIAVSTGGNVGAFVEPDGTVRTVQDQGTINDAIGKLPSGEYAVEAVAGETCTGRSEKGGCTVYARAVGATPGLWSVDDHGTVAEIDGFTGLAGVSPTGDLAGQTKVLTDGSCWAVRANDGREKWSTCDYSLESFSPGGNLVLASNPFHSGTGDSTLAVLDAETGEVLLDLRTADNAFITEAVWEDGNHVLMTVFDRGRWAVERVDVHTGGREYAGALAEDGEGPLVVTADEIDPPFQLG